MASPVLQKLSPKSPLTFKQALTKSLTVGLSVAQTAAATSAPSKTGLNATKNFLKPSPPDSVTAPSPSQFANSFVSGRKSDDGTTPQRKAPTPFRRISPDSPLLVGNFSTTKACNALVQSPCRLYNYNIQRRRLYHQDSTEDNGSVSSAPGSACSYQSTPKIGKGGFGSVYIGKYDGKIVAIKQLHNTQKDRVKGETLCAELNAFKLNHPNIVKILTFTCSGSLIQIVYEYVGRRNLQTVLDDNDDLLSDAQHRLRFAREIAEALRFCHENRVLHLDVKPANVLVTDAGDVCKLGDFGCSRCLPPNCDFLPMTPQGTAVAGTLIYKAPELLRGMPASIKCDVYSFAYVVWQLVTRQRPFDSINAHTVVFCVVAKNLRPSIKAPSPESNFTDIDRPLLDLTERCWLSEPEERPDFESVCKILNRL